MSQQHRNIPPASTRAPSSSALPREHDDDTHNAGGAGGKAAERGRQPPAATRPPCTPSSQNTVNIAPNIQQLIDTAAALLTALDAPNGSSTSIQTPTLRAFLREARDMLTSLQQEPTTHRPQTRSSERSRQSTKLSKRHPVWHHDCSVRRAAKVKSM